MAASGPKLPLHSSDTEHMVAHKGKARVDAGDGILPNPFNEKRPVNRPKRPGNPAHHGG